MEILSWSFGGFSILGGLWAMFRYPRPCLRLLGLLPALAYLVSMAVVLRGWSHPEEITLHGWLFFWLALPIVCGVTGLMLAADAERSRTALRMRQVMESWRPPEPRGPYR